jgi:hypothetical protein
MKTKQNKTKQMEEQGHHLLGGALQAPGACYEIKLN